MKTVKTEKEHIPQIARIAAESFPDPWTENGFMSSLDVSGNIFLTAQENGETTGYIIGTADGDFAGIDSIAVAVCFRRQGIAEELIRRFCEIAAQSDSCSSVSLEVRENNLPARALYKKCGFSEIGLRKNFYSAPRENAVVMNKIIKEENLC
ncbi:MAG: ribosomal protein S18-alanine N-acetyltransferase [Oscillospiraceae bacterium]